MSLGYFSGMEIFRNNTLLDSLRHVSLAQGVHSLFGSLQPFQSYIVAWRHGIVQQCTTSTQPKVNNCRFRGTFYSSGDGEAFELSSLLALLRNLFSW